MPQDPQDRLDLGSRPGATGEDGPRAAGPIAEALAEQPEGSRSKFLMVWFRCCHAYGRLTRNRDDTAFEGRCPSCGVAVHAAIGPNGTSRRIFEAR